MTGKFENVPNGRWDGIVRPYGEDEVKRISGTVRVDHTISRMMSIRLWNLLNRKNHVAALGALSGTQAIQMVRAGLEAVYLSGWQVAADANLAGHTYPDQSLYPANSVPTLVKRINNAFQREDVISTMNGVRRESYVPILADAEAGFGGPLNVFELTKSMIEAGAAGIHLEDQLSSEKKCGHLGGKVLIPTSSFIRNLVSARLASDVLGVPLIIVARTDALSARLITNDIDPLDQEFIGRGRTSEGFYDFEGSLDACISRGLAYAPYSDMLWFETASPDVEQAKTFAKKIHEKFPGKHLAYNCSPSFNWKTHLSPEEIEGFQDELGKLGYKFQFITLAGFHALNLSMFELATGYREHGMAAYSMLQQREFQMEPMGYGAVKHQSFVGTGYFDEVMQVISGSESSTTALGESTEARQF